MARFGLAPSSPFAPSLFTPSLRWCGSCSSSQAATGVRSFSSRSKANKDVPEEDSGVPTAAEEETAHLGETIEEPNGLQQYYPTLMTYGPAVLGGGVTVYIISKGALYLTSTFMNMSLTYIGYVGFMAGLGSGAVCASLFWWFWRTFGIRPEPVYQEALKVIQSDPDAVERLGKITLGSVKSGAMRAYKLDGGNFDAGDGSRGVSVGFGSKRLVRRYPRVQMLFQTHGSKNQGMVTVEAVKKNGQTVFKLIALDMLTTDEYDDPLLVDGTEDRLYVRDQLAGFVDFKKMYVDTSEGSKADRGPFKHGHK
jgi:hypothetical protein